MLRNIGPCSDFHVMQDTDPTHPKPRGLYVRRAIKRFVR